MTSLATWSSGVEVSREIMATIMDRIEPVTESGCWIYQGYTNTKGYPRIQITGRNCGVHRIVFEHFTGPIPDGLQLDHLCRVRCCVNPAHLEPVTCQENVLRGTGATSRNAQKTHCLYGHELTRLTRPKKSGVLRVCLICTRAYHRKYKIAKKLAAIRAKAKEGT